MKFELTDKMYDRLVLLAQIILPAVATLYCTLSEIWGLPYGPEITGTIVAIDTFLGAVLKIANTKYKKKIPPKQ